MREELLEEIRWLSDVKAVKRAWTVEKSPTEAGVDAPEYYSIIFDDSHILDAAEDPAFSEYERVLVLEFARSLKAAARSRKLYSVDALLLDPHFRIAQKIASLL